MNKKYEKAVSLLPSLRRTNPDDGCLGMVGRVPPGVDARELEAKIKKIKGLRVSLSDNDNDESFLWVVEVTK